MASPRVKFFHLVFERPGPARARFTTCARMIFSIPSFLLLKLLLLSLSQLSFPMGENRCLYASNAIESVTNATSTQPLEKFYRHLLLPAFSRVKRNNVMFPNFQCFEPFFGTISTCPGKPSLIRPLQP